MSDVLYVYGIAHKDVDLRRAPAGIDDTTVTTIAGADATALVSRLPMGEYGAEAVETKTADVSWLSPRAMAHDRVLTWAHDHGGIIPLPMFSMWESQDSLARWLGGGAQELNRLFARIAHADEFGLRIHRRDSVMLEGIDDLDADLAQLKREAERAAPGQRYLLERKIAEQGKSAVRAASQRLARDAFDQLRALSREAIARPLGSEAGRVPDATLVLNGAFLVDRARTEEFRGAVAALARAQEPRGLAFDFTGPWPPYHFVASDALAGSRSRGEQGAR